MIETPIVFPCGEYQLLGILHTGKPDAKIGVIVIVGGPQYRVGSHRQFLLLSRHLAEQGYPVMRFDYRGMGDSEGEAVTFENIDEDIRSAIDAMYVHCPGLNGVVLWGLCDAASAIAFYAHADHRVCGSVLLNPWVHTEEGRAETYLRHYYLKRLISREFWGKFFSGGFELRVTLNSIIADVVAAVKGRVRLLAQSIFKLSDVRYGLNNLALPDRMLCGLQQFKKPVLLILSGRDYTADEFRDLISRSKDWKKWIAGSKIKELIIPETDHTFSSAIWRDTVANETLFWLKELLQVLSG